MEAAREILGWHLFTVGDTRTSVGSLLAIAGITIVTLILGRLARSAMSRFVLRLNKDDCDAARAYGLGLQLLFWFIGLEVVLHILGLHLTTILAASGFLALGAGFAAKDIVQNLMSGGILRIEKTMQPNDLIIVEDQWLIVERVGMRTTKALTYDGEEVLIPNSLIAQSKVANLTRNDRLHRIRVQLGVAYESDLDVVRKTLQQSADELEWRSKARAASVYLRKFGDSSVNYDLVVWIDDANESRRRSSDLHEAVWWALKRAGITIAYPQLDVHVGRPVLDTKPGPPESPTAC